MAISSPFRSTQRVYFDDLDALNILHNVRFLLFMERARGEFLEALGFRWSDDLERNPDKWHVVAAHEIRYLSPVRGEGDVSVELRPLRLGRSSFVLHCVLRSVHGDTVFAEATTRIVRLDHETNRPCAWSPAFRQAMTPLLPATAATDGGGS